MNISELRPFRIDVFSLQDDFICTLHSYKDNFIGQITDVKLVESTDGSSSLSFSIPKYYISQEDNKKHLNPRWEEDVASYQYDMGSVYSVLAENTRILKAFVRFDDKVKIYPFIIDKIVDSRDDNFSVYKQVSANGLAFAELGKVGYKLELTQDILELEVEKDNTIVPTIDYWLDKVFPSEKDANGKVKRWLTPWCYEVKTEYYESDRVAGKVYDEEYVNNWNVGSDGTLTAASYEPTRKHLSCFAVMNTVAMKEAVL